MLTRKRLAVWGVAGFFAFAVVCFLVGHFASRDSQFFDWELAALIGTAIGTTALAVGTGALAYTTSGDVRATWALAELSRADQEVRQQPLMLIVGWEWSDEEPPEDVSGVLRILLRNVGLGPAAHLVIEARYTAGDAQAEIFPGIASAVMPGEEVSFSLPVIFSGQTPEGAEYGGFELGGSYFDRRGRDYEIQFAPFGHGSGAKWSDPMTTPAVVAERRQML